ncbi:capsular biosynthesis protein [Halomonas sp. BC2]|uniref:capsular biosynthesis protein n=1 Tax=Halomonas sp. BC2 TaxID=1670449 RepID=UPI0009BF9FA2|nr:capsular biosynthesis protein [Halomonas sp. BC2]
MIVIPMAGLSSRFKKDGFQLPKYMLEAHGYTLFYHSVASFKKYFGSEKFLFIALDVFDTKTFIQEQCELLGLCEYDIVTLSAPTNGQAETVYLGVESAGVSDDTSLLIFNIDTFRPGFTYPDVFDLNEIDGYLETFVGEGANWSNVKPSNELLQTVEFTAEKKEISQYCCTGLYFWNRKSDFSDAFIEAKSAGLSNAQAGEFYIAPMYNTLIKKGKDVRYSVVDINEVVFCGTPDEYYDFLKCSLS